MLRRSLLSKDRGTKSLLCAARDSVRSHLTAIASRTATAFVAGVCAPSAVAVIDPPPSAMVWGLRRKLSVAKLWVRVGWLALRLYRTPLRAAKALRRWRTSQAPVGHLAPRKAAVVSGRLFLNFYFPGWPSRAFDRSVERELDRVDPVLGRPPALRAAIVAITRRCPLRCEHCVEWDVLNQHEGLSADELQAILRQLRQRGVAQVFLSGGEPLQRFDVLLELTASMAAESDVWVLSSGQGLTMDKAKRLRDAGLTGVALSLDHWEAAAHDRFRGRAGSFEAVQRAAGQVRDAGLVLALSLCPVRAFVSEGNLARYGRLARSLGASFIQVVEPKAVGHYTDQDVALEPAQREVLEQFTDWLNRDPDVRELPAVSYMDRYARGAGCRGGSEYAYVDTDGSLHPCPFCREHPVPLHGHDIDGAMARLQSAGCPAQDCHCAARTPS